MPWPAARLASSAFARAWTNIGEYMLLDGMLSRGMKVLLEARCWGTKPAERDLRRPPPDGGLQKFATGEWSTAPDGVRRLSIYTVCGCGSVCGEKRGGRGDSMGGGSRPQETYTSYITANGRKVQALQLLASDRDCPRLFEPRLVALSTNVFRFVGFDRGSLGDAGMGVRGAVTLAANASTGRRRVRHQC
jgi:hypothetical protein